MQGGTGQGKARQGNASRGGATQGGVSARRSRQRTALGGVGKRVAQGAEGAAQGGADREDSAMQDRVAQCKTG